MPAWALARARAHWYVVGVANLEELVAELARGQERLVLSVEKLSQGIQEQRDEIREHRKEAGELRILMGRILDRFDRVVDGEIADLRKRIERLESH